MKEQDETPTMEAESHSRKFLKTAVAKASSLKKGNAKEKKPGFKRFGGK